jgi:hypothetical protein
VRSERTCVWRWPPIGQDLRLRGCAEQLSVEELIPESAVERLGKAVLPLGTWLDVIRTGGGAGRIAVPLSLANEHRPVVRSECRFVRLHAKKAQASPAQVTHLPQKRAVLRYLNLPGLGLHKVQALNESADNWRTQGFSPTATKDNKLMKNTEVLHAKRWMYLA